MNNQLWNTYQDVKDELEKQYHPGKPFNPDSGKDVKQLEAEIKGYVKANADQPHIILKARTLAKVLTEAQIRIDPEDWFADHINTGHILWGIQAQWRAEIARTVPKCPWTAKNVSWPVLDLSHTTPSWRSILKYGLKGLRDRALQARPTAQDQEAQNFFSAVAIVYQAAVDYVKRLANEARRIGALRVIDVLDAIAERPPKTYHEALQLAFIYNQIQEIEGEYVRSQGVFDQLFYPYYKHDIDNGILTREQAMELTCFFFDKFSAQHFGANNNICFGGRTPDGKDLANELTDLAFQCWLDRKNIDPKFSYRIHANSDPKRLEFLAKAIKSGQNAVVFANDDCAYDMFTRRGKAPEDVIDFVPIGCYEPAIMGKELSCTMSATVNLARVAELIFEPDEVPLTFDEVKQRTHAILDQMLDETLQVSRAWEQTWPYVNPSPIMSGTFDCAIEKQRDASHSGMTYNTSGVMCGGIATLADALAAINYAVFQKQLLSWQELKETLKNNWDGQEKLRQTLLKKAPKYGNNQKDADDLLHEFATAVARRINDTPNSKGDTFQCGLWSIDRFIDFGKQTGATPDGRLAGTPISKNIAPTVGADEHGVTALLLSAAKIPHNECPDGTILDVTLHPSALSGENGHLVICDLVKTYFSYGGFFIHFNVLDPETLKEAQQEPEKHRNLQIRVCGWNARFLNMNKALQDQFIKEAETL